MATHLDVLDLWRTQAELSDDLRAEGIEIGVSGVGMWRVRGDIPAFYWPALVKIAERKNLTLPPDGEPVTLAFLAATQKRSRKHAPDTAEAANARDA